MPFDKIDGTVAAGATYNHPADGVIELTLTTKAAVGGTRIMFRRPSSGNLWYATMHSDGNIYLSKNVAGTLTQVASSTGGSADGAHIEIYMLDEHIEVFSNGASKLTYTSASQFKTETGGKRNNGSDTGMTALVEQGVVTNLKSWTIPCYDVFF